jgi:serine/threonine protein kinase
VPLLIYPLQVGTKLTSSIDTYAFGIMMWELYTGQRPYANMDRTQIMAHVCWNSRTFDFPPGTPGLYSSLAHRCWAPLPKMRPDFSTILKQLQALARAPQAQLKPTYKNKELQ